MDVSSEMIHALLPLFLTVGLGASVVVVGLIEGIAEATVSILLNGLGDGAGSYCYTVSGERNFSALGVDSCFA